MFLRLFDIQNERKNDDCYSLPNVIFLFVCSKFKFKWRSINNCYLPVICSLYFQFGCVRVYQVDLWKLNECFRQKTIQFHYKTFLMFEQMFRWPVINVGQTSHYVTTWLDAIIHRAESFRLFTLLYITRYLCPEQTRVSHTCNNTFKSI